MPRHALALILAAIVTLAMSGTCALALTADGITSDVFQIYDAAQNARLATEHTIDSSLLGNYTVGQVLVGLVILIFIVLVVIFVTSNFLLFIVIVVLLAAVAFLLNYAGVI